MVQNWTEDPYEPSYEIAFTMTATENNFKCLRSNFSGTGLPASPTAGQLFFNTTTQYYKYYDGSAWNDLTSDYIRGDAALKLWVYSNTAISGWIIDSSVYDVVLAFKGGTNAYNVNGGVVAGTWDGAGFVHTHAWFSSKENPSPMSVSTFKTFTKEGVLQNLNIAYADCNVDYYGDAIAADRVVLSECAPPILEGATDVGSGEFRNFTSTGVHDGTNSYRPAAAVGTMQYPDMS
jgi:hypothetical protein